MITKMTGQVVSVGTDFANVAIGGFEYEVLVPDFVRRQLQSQMEETISLFTRQYLEGNPAQGRLVPRLIGFLSEAEREFFDLFTSVDGVGVRKGLRAMIRPVPEIAQAIESQDAQCLATLPGIGIATAERIVAKLRRKVPQFALMVPRPEPSGVSVEPNVIDEAFAALQAVGHSAADAQQLIEQAMGKKKKFKDVQDLLLTIYQQNQPEN